MVLSPRSPETPQPTGKDISDERDSCYSVGDDGPDPRQILRVKVLLSLKNAQSVQKIPKNFLWHYFVALSIVTGPGIIEVIFEGVPTTFPPVLFFRMTT